MIKLPDSIHPASSMQPPKRLSDPFDGYFRKGTKWTPRGGGLLDVSNAKRWFEVIGWGSHNDPFSLQQKLASKPFGRRTLIVVEGVYSMVDSLPAARI